MFLIMSAAYVDAELQSEFGRIPPSFLPLGNKRLFQHQVELKPNHETVYISLPESYRVSSTDSEWLENNNVIVISVPDNLNLGESLVATLNLIQSDLDSSLSVLFGDTLFNQLPMVVDVVSVSQVESSYNWAVVTNDLMHWLKTSELGAGSSDNNVVSGFFHFSKPREIVRCITLSHWNFLDGLNRYHQSTGLTSIYLDGWLDFGHVNTYYQSKAHYTTQRSFNDLNITLDYVEKSSKKIEKILGESEWFSKLPFPLRHYTPQYLGLESTPFKTSYKLEYLHNTALNELYVFSELPSNIWELILDCCIGFLKKCKAEAAPEGAERNDLTSLFLTKTFNRVEVFLSDRDFLIDELWVFNKDLTVSVKKMIQDSVQIVNDLHDTEPSFSVIHGDFCFSNILYDFRANRIKVIDPRGINNAGDLTIYGDIRYDIAKLSHSIIGMYDGILAGYYNAKIDGRNIEFYIEESKTQIDIQKIFIDKIKSVFSISESELIAMQVLLFLSMLPFHSDDKNRQNALFANAFRLYRLMKELN